MSVIAQFRPPVVCVAGEILGESENWANEQRTRAKMKIGATNSEAGRRRKWGEQTAKPRGEWRKGDLKPLSRG